MKLCRVLAWSTSFTLEKKRSFVSQGTELTGQTRRLYVRRDAGMNPNYHFGDDTRSSQRGENQEELIFFFFLKVRSAAVRCRRFIWATLHSAHRGMRVVKTDFKQDYKSSNIMFSESLNHLWVQIHPCVTCGERDSETSPVSSRSCPEPSVVR